MTKRKDAQPDDLPAEPAPTEPFVAEVEAAAPVTPDPVIEPASAELKPEPPPAPPSRGFVGPVLGGVIATVAGFALSHFNVLGLRAPDQAEDVAALSAQLGNLQSTQASALDKLSADLSVLSDRVGKLEAVPAPTAPDLSRLDDLDQRLAAIEAVPADGNASTAALSAKVADLEKRLAAVPSGSDEALQKKLDDALARLTEAEAAATARAADADAAAQAAARTQTLDALGDKLASGAPFKAELDAVGDETLTSALSGLADAGVPSLAQLQESFPDAAREGLRVARDLSTDTGWSDRLVDFLAAQTGARPLTPQEGATPDAILSRAEFALSEGRVADALAELDQLDAAVKAPLDAWIADAKAHLAAAAALQAARGE